MTTISTLTTLSSGATKSTIFSRSAVTVRLPIAMSAWPSVRSVSSLSRVAGDDVDRDRPLAELLRVFLVDPALEVADELGAAGRARDPCR